MFVCVWVWVRANEVGGVGGWCGVHVEGAWVGMGWCVRLRVKGACVVWVREKEQEGEGYKN